MNSSLLLGDPAVLARGARSGAGEAFDVMKADCCRWRDRWPAVADWVGMAVGGVATETLADSRREAGPAWQAMAAAHRLAEPDVGRVADWSYGDFMFRIGWDDLSSTVKIRKAGFGNAVGSWESIRGALDEYRARRVIP